GCGQGNHVFRIRQRRCIEVKLFALPIRKGVDRVLAANAAGPGSGNTSLALALGVGLPVFDGYLPTCGAGPTPLQRPLEMPDLRQFRQIQTLRVDGEVQAVRRAPEIKETAGLEYAIRGPALDVC